MLRLLPLLSGPLLEELAVRPPASTTMAQMTEFYSAVSTHCQPSSLLSFHNDCLEYSDVESYQIELDAFRVLCRFTKLTSILVSTGGGFQFGEDIVEELARACPALTELRLRQFTEDSPFTLSILARLAAHCEDLSVLEITVDTAVIPSIYPTPDTGERLSHLALREFSAGYSVLEDAFPVAHFLSSVFPSLNIVCARRDANEEHDEADAIIEKRWEEVEALIPKLGAIRKEEQAWATHAVAKS
ncbi:hypothetical protein C8F01DRAFT_1152224 [Mycena amicta]|nr:hypothetical protein C8F01DRAFT_1152224 [Mycena amicta]